MKGLSIVALMLEQKEAVGEIRLQGAVGVSSAAELKTLISQALAGGQGLSIDVHEVAEMDVCALQLLIAAEREWKLAGRSFSLVGPLSDAVSAAIAEAGFEPLEIHSTIEVPSEV